MLTGRIKKPRQTFELVWKAVLVWLQPLRSDNDRTRSSKSSEESSETTRVVSLALYVTLRPIVNKFRGRRTNWTVFFFVIFLFESFFEKLQEVVGTSYRREYLIYKIELKVFFTSQIRTCLRSSLNPQKAFFPSNLASSAKAGNSPAASSARSCGKKVELNMDC